MSILKWGILGCGKISHDFVSSLASLPSKEHEVVACGARKIEAAKEFAKTHGIKNAYDSYKDVIGHPDVQVVYIGSINPQHKELAMLAIDHGKGVLLEKPLCMNVKETKELIQHARMKKVFLMEAIWSRFFPAYKKLKEEIDSGSIGDVLYVSSNFATMLQGRDRCRLKEMGGGTLLDIGIYNIQFASLIFGGKRPQKIVAAGNLNAEGVDESSTATLLYPGGKMANLVAHGGVRFPCDAQVVGTKGIIKLPGTFWCPTELETPKGKLTFDLPATTKKFNYGNSQGLSYEADEVRRCIQAGLTESPKMTLDESLSIAEILEEIRKQVGVTYPQDQ